MIVYGLRLLLLCWLMSMLTAAIVIGRSKLSSTTSSIAYTWVDNRYNSRVMLIDAFTGLRVNLLDSLQLGTVEGRTPLWSPDGRHLAFWTYVNRTDTFVYQITFPEYQARNLSAATSFLSLPIYSGDGRVAFPERANVPDVPLYVVDPDGVDQQILIEAQRGNAQWSPDGTRIAYIARLNEADGAEELSRDANSAVPEIDLFTLDTVSGDVRNWTTNLDTVGRPMWSPDGTRIAFRSSLRDVGQLYLLDLRDGTLTSLVDTIEAISDPVWSPDGRYLAFSGNLDNFEIVRYDLETGAVENLSRHPAYDLYPTWSPDGRHLVFVSRRSGQDDLYRVRLADGQITRLTTQSGNRSDPAWQPAPR